MNRWQLTDLARASLQSLADCGVAVTPQDVLDIQARSIEATENPDNEVSFARGRPVRIGTSEVFIWPLTFVGADFVARLSPSCRRESAIVLLLAYACHFGADAERMRDSDSPRIVKRKIQRWADGLPVTIGEIGEAVARVMSTDAASNVDASEADNEGIYADLAADIVAATGQPPEVVEHLMSIDYAVEIAKRIKLAADANLARSLADDARTKGLGRLAKTLSMIKKRNGESN